MKTFNRKVSLGIDIMYHLFKEQKKASIMELSVHLNESPYFMAQVIRALRQNGYVEVTRGRKGGYTLLKAALNKTLASFLYVMGSPIQSDNDNGLLASVTAAQSLDIAAANITLGKVFFDTLDNENNRSGAV